MSLKTSFFNKSIFRTDIKRFWWISLLETLMLIMVCAFPVYQRCTANYYGYSIRNLITWMNGSVAILFAFSIGVSILLFSYLHNGSSVSGYHCLPVKRKNIFATKLLSGAVITLTPIIICGIILLIMLTNPDISNQLGVMQILKWTACGIIYTCTLFSLTTLVNQFTGNSIGTLIFTGGILVLPALIWSFFDGFFFKEIYGYVHYSGKAMEYIYASEKMLMTVPGFALYAAFTLIFTALAYLLYKKRRLEVHGEVIAFSWLTPVFIGIVGLLSGMLSYVYFTEILHIQGVWTVIPLGILGTGIAYMISRKSLSLKGIIKPLSVYIAAALCFCCVIEFDLTGFETRVPEIEDVKSVRITYGNTHHYYHYDGYELTYTLPGQIQPDFTDEADIKNVMVLHEHCIKNRDRFDADRQIPIEYTLKNGKTFKRRYNISYMKDAEYLKPIYETKEMRADIYELANGGDREFTGVTVRDRRLKDNLTFYPDNNNMNRITDALIKDLSEILYDRMFINTGGSVTIEASYNNNFVYSSEPPESFSSDNVQKSQSICQINDSFTNTVKVLTELGFYSSIPTASDIEGATIAVWKDENSPHEYSIKDVDSGLLSARENAVSVTDPAEIEKLYSVYDSMIEGKKYTNYNNRLNILIAYRVKGTGHVFEVSCSYDEDKIPEVLKKYFEGKI